MRVRVADNLNVVLDALEEKASLDSAYFLCQTTSLRTAAEALQDVASNLNLFIFNFRSR